MEKVIRVLIVEDDFFARNSIELLLRRDWRTKVIGVAKNSAELYTILNDLNGPYMQADVIIIDTDIPNNREWLTQVLDYLNNYGNESSILFTGVEPNARVIALLRHQKCVGYVLKDEIRFSIASAVSRAITTSLVITPGIHESIEKLKNVKPPKGTLIMDGREPFFELSETDVERARMSFIFSMERTEFADETGLDESYSYGVVSDLFEKIGLNGFLNGDFEPKTIFGDDPIVLKHFQDAIETVQFARKKAKDQVKEPRMPRIKEKESLAFHLLTYPQVQEIQ